MSITKLSTLDMIREEWLDLRRRGIGGSDAATVVGLNPYSSRLYLYAEKLGLIPEREDNEAMRQGRDLEDYVAQRWMEATGKKVRRENHILYSDQYPWAFANVDRMVVGEKAVLECKTTSVYNKHDFDNGEIPDYYYVQCQHYMAVTGYPKAYLAVLVLNKGFYTFEIARNDAEIDALMEAERRFWEEHIQTQTPPDADGSDSARFVLDQVERSNQDTAMLMDLEGVFEQLQRTEAMIKELNDEKEDMRQKIIQSMGTSECGQSMTWKASYLEQSRTSIDARKLQRLYPQAYNDCSKVSTYRVFRSSKIEK